MGIPNIGPAIVDELIVKFKSTTPTQQINETICSINSDVESRLPMGSYILVLRKSWTSGQLQKYNAILSKNPAVEWVEYNLTGAKLAN